MIFGIHISTYVFIQFVKRVQSPRHSLKKWQIYESWYKGATSLSYFARRRDWLFLPHGCGSDLQLDVEGDFPCARFCGSLRRSASDATRPLRLSLDTKNNEIEFHRGNGVSRPGCKRKRIDAEQPANSNKERRHNMLLTAPFAYLRHTARTLTQQCGDKLNKT